ncbi:MAG: hypothetical protein OXI79_20840 [Gammaproteobacteria bacterium]|nr:hypothetical protein [Gammaproteobacteria bacterium]
MSNEHRERLAHIRRFDQLVAYLRDELGWPIESDDFEEITYDYTPEELGIAAENAAKIQEIKQLRPLVVGQPWGIFFVKFEPKRLPVVALRRILGRVVIKKRASANRAELPAWAADDLLFVSNYGERSERRIALAHFAKPEDDRDLPSLKVLGWDNLDTPLHLDAVALELTKHLTWPDDEGNHEAWRVRWRGAFKLGHREVVTTSKQLSERLAELARAIRDRIETALAIENDSGALTKLLKAFQAALLHDLDEAGFADMYAQTIAYGLLSARITDPTRRAADDLATHMRTNPFLKELMETFLHVGGRRNGPQGTGIDFDELGVSDVVELLDQTTNMEAVVRDFGDRNPLEDPVIHFYEHFLAAYDKQQKVSRGVFYTPRPVVSYIVHAVDEVLRSEFGLSDGLADTTTWGEMVEQHTGLKIPEGIAPGSAFVQILDPATGTGTFLVEIIDLIHRTMVAHWQGQGHGAKKIDALWNDYVPENLLPRLHGYELLMAPYAITHLKIGLKLYETGYRFESDERARVYLTNALEPPSDEQLMLDFLPALAHEADSVNEIKRTQRLTVLVGNPPYAGHSRNNQLPWIVDRVYDYKRNFPDLQKPGQAKWLQDDYVKFLRLAEWQIARSASGVVGFITNHAWLDNPTFKGMRKRLLDSFDLRYVLDLHGNANRKEIAADGSPDENVFEIKQGVAITVLAKRPVPILDEQQVIQRRDLLGSESYKSKNLVANTGKPPSGEIFKVLPPEYVFEPRDEEKKAEYEQFRPLPSIFNQNGDPAPGIVTTHDEFAISFTREEQIQKVEALLATRNETAARRLFRLCSQSQWDYARAKRELRKRDWREAIVPVLYRPFDVRFTGYDRHIAVHRRERVSQQMLDGWNCALISCRQRSVRDIWRQVLVTQHIIESTAISNKTKEINYLFPLWLLGEWPVTAPRANIDPTVAESVTELTGLMYRDRPPARSKRLDWRSDFRTEFGPQDLFDWIYAVLHSETYRLRYSEFLKSDFARVPLPRTKALFQALARQGHALIERHLLRPRSGKVSRIYTGPKHPAVGRVGWSEGTVWLDAVKTSAREGHRAIKPGTMGFRDVPEEVWDFHIGGYQVCHKWLKDRNGRKLSAMEIDHYQQIVAALRDTIRVVAEIDGIIEMHGGWPVAFHRALGEVERRSTVLMAAEMSPPYVVTETKTEPVYRRSLPEIERTLRRKQITVPEGKRFTDLDREGKSCAIWCVLHGEGSMSHDDGAIKLSAARLKHAGWADYERLDQRSHLYQEIDDTLKRATRHGNGWLDKPANLHVRAYRRYSEMSEEEWRDCVMSVLSRNEAVMERSVVIREAFNDARQRFGIGRENLVRSVEVLIRSAINSCIRRGYIQREGSERLVLLARYDDPR